MASYTIAIGKVCQIEGKYTKEGADGLRIKVQLPLDQVNSLDDIPWAFPILPKVFQSVPKVGESVFVFKADEGKSDRYYLGPIISQPQFQTYCSAENAKSLLSTKSLNPLEKISKTNDTRGSFPNQEDVAIVGRGAEDVILKYNDNTKASEIDLRAGIRQEPTNSSDSNMIGNIIFNDTDPAYIQLKYKTALMTGEEHEGNSVINLVANRINIMSNKDQNIAHNLGDKDALIPDNKMTEIMDNLHPVPMGDKLVELLELLKGCILNHVHSWPGMVQCGDDNGDINKLLSYDIESILSDYVKIS